jgi:PAS domain S-box-containing protein
MEKQHKLLPDQTLFIDDLEKMADVIQFMPDATIVVDQRGKIALLNEQAELLFQYAENDLVGKSVEILVPETLGKVHDKHRQNYLNAPETRSMGAAYNLMAVCKDGVIFPVDISLRPIQTHDGLFILTVIRDITILLEARDAIQRSKQYARDILSSVSAHIAVLNKDGIIEDVNLGWKLFADANGGSPATRNGKGLNYIQICRQAKGDGSESAGEIADGIEAVLRNEKAVFDREYPCHSPTEERWFLCQVTPLSTQNGGVVISHINITEQIKAQKELLQAYETTLDGWSRAMDLRDDETAGHTQRVTSMTVSIARAMGVDEETIVHMRRGALLHDMGKLGVPDTILLKSGELTAEEWDIMRQHPQSAYDMLSPIAFLNPALDIPYCHHEKWDGTGYPRGLKGEEIPFAARIFAVADVWDALRSDRPYRKSWPADRVREHIRSLSGTHFDPDVVDVFMKMCGSEFGVYD